jgi:hypothetical protein
MSCTLLGSWACIYSGEGEQALEEEAGCLTAQTEQARADKRAVIEKLIQAEQEVLSRISCVYCLQCTAGAVFCLACLVFCRHFH